MNQRTMTPLLHESEQAAKVRTHAQDRSWNVRPGAARYLGNAHLEDQAAPRIHVSSYTRSSKPPVDQAPVEVNEADQTMSVTTFTPHGNGIQIVAEMEGVYSSPEYPDGWHWTQTIDTNVPLGGATSPYVDPRPNDDTKPFYWTDAEAAANPTTFSDRPSRGIPAAGTTNWRATLSLNGVNATTVTRFDTIIYGFDLDSAGTVTAQYPASAGASLVATHQATLAAEFPAWTFK